MTNDADDTLMTVQEAAVHTGISEAGIRARVQSGSLPVTRFGGHRAILIPRAALDALLLRGGGPRRTR